MIYKQKLLLRADGNNLIGFGHIYRLLALADILREHYYLVFALYKSSDFIEKEISNYCDEIISLPGELPFKTPDEIAASEEIDFDLTEVLKGDEIVVLDGYYFGTAYQQAVKQKNCKLVCIDDQAINYFYADAVINHAPGVDENIYRKEAYTKLCTGLEYAILRKPFFEPVTEYARIKGDVFISLGGSDYFQITCKLVQFLQQYPQFATLHIMCSSSFPASMMDELQSKSDQSEKVKLYRDVAATGIVALMDTCEYAFVSASTVLLEAYARGLKCFAGYYVNNQLFIYNGFSKENKIIGLANLKDLDENIFQLAMSKATQVTLIKDVLQSNTSLLKIFSAL